MVQYLPIVLMLALAVAFAAGSFVASGILGPKRATAAKEVAYESGIVPRRAPSPRFPVRFYLVAMIFIIFDIEVVFLYPWAVMYRQLAGFGLAEMAVFVGIVFVSFAYLVSNGALDWGPVHKLVDRPRSELTRGLGSVRRVPRPIEVALDGPGLLEVEPDGGGSAVPAATIPAPDALAAGVAASTWSRPQPETGEEA
jgi:NADH-quinone oxidoreductase subunit A